MISVEHIARLAALYDHYNNAFDPLSEEARRVKKSFEELIGNLHATHASDVNFVDFRYELVQRCREYLRKN